MSALLAADNIVSVGYSFPEQDNYFYDLLFISLLAKPCRRTTLRIVDSNLAGAEATRDRLINHKLLRTLCRPSRKLEVIAMDLDGFHGIRIGRS